MTSELAWYDRILIFLPDLYRPRIFTLIALVVLCFWGVKLNWAFEWDVVLTSYFFLGPCSVLTLLTTLWCFHARRFQFRHRYTLIDLVLLGIALVLGYAAVKESDYIYQGEYKFSRQWREIQVHQELLIPLEGDPQKYSGKRVAQTSIEPISSIASPSIEITIWPGGDNCHILQSYPEFAWEGPLAPKTVQTKGSVAGETEEHKWILQKMKKHMRVVMNVGIGSSTTSPPETACQPELEVEEK